MQVGKAGQDPGGVCPRTPPEGTGAILQALTKKTLLGGGCGCGSCGHQPSLPGLYWGGPGSPGLGSLHLCHQGTQYCMTDALPVACRSLCCT